jgi:hypothetical protein
VASRPETACGDGERRAGERTEPARGRTRRLNKEKRPFKIDLDGVDNNEKLIGIYEFKDEQLLLALLTVTEGITRPVDFTGQMGIAVLFERVK